MENTLRVIKYLKIYHLAVAFIYLLSGLCFGAFLALAIFSSNGVSDPREKVVMGIVFAIMIVTILLIVCLHLLGAYLANKPTKFAYYYEFVWIILGLPSIITVIPAIYFLIQYTKPEIKKFYGV